MCFILFYFIFLITNPNYEYTSLYRLNNRHPKPQPLTVQGALDCPPNNPNYEVAFSHYGEMSPDVFRLVDYLSTRVKHSPENRNRLDGFTPTELSKKLRRDLVTQLMVELVQGWGYRLGVIGI